MIRSLKIPQPSSQNPVSEREVLFPAHLINLVTSQMWRYGFVKESERFLASVMQAIQQQVMVLCPLYVSNDSPLKVKMLLIPAYSGFQMSKKCCLLSA